MTLTPGTVASLRQAGLDPDEVTRLVTGTLAEDLGDTGDVTSDAIVAADTVLQARYVARQAGTLAGLPVLAAVVDIATRRTGRLRLLAADGQPVTAGQPLAELDGSARDLLKLERTSLNLLSHLSGVATATAAWVAAVEGTGVRVRDTRKTMPLLRSLQKYAVRCGGGTNHRAGLYDAVLIKDNHVAAAGGVRQALDATRRLATDLVVQTEVDDLDQLAEALQHGARLVMLDNFDVPALREAVEYTRARHPGVLLEASGGLSVEHAADVAATGIDFLAVGALTHSVVALDIGLDFTSARSADGVGQVDCG